jgi:hypothetical protein
MAHQRGRPAGGRSIPDPGFGGDDGSAHPVVAAALAAYASDPGRRLEVFLALQSSRLLVPVVAVPGRTEPHARGSTHDETDGPRLPERAEMATALLTGRDGRLALLAFTSLESLAAWRADARPVPVAAVTAARSAVTEGAAALVVDVAGPTTYAVEGRLLEGLAQGWMLVPSADGAVWVAPPGQE